MPKAQCLALNIQTLNRINSVTVIYGSSAANNRSLRLQATIWGRLVRSEASQAAALLQTRTAKKNAAN